MPSEKSDAPIAGKKMSDATKAHLAALKKKKAKASAGKPKRKVSAATLAILAKGRAKRAANLKKKATAGSTEVELTEQQKAALKKHGAHHTKKHMDEMKRDMRAGHSLATAHRRAKQKVGD